MNRDLINYISAEKAAGRSPDEIRTSLLIKGWKPEDVDTVLPSDNAPGSDKGKYAKLSLGLFAISVMLYYAFTPLTVVSTFAGIIFGFMGVRSNHKVMSIISIVLHVIATMWIIFIIYAFLHVEKTHTWPFTNEPLTNEELVEFGLTEE